MGTIILITVIGVGLLFLTITVVENLILTKYDSLWLEHVYLFLTDLDAYICIRDINYDSLRVYGNLNEYHSDWVSAYGYSLILSNEYKGSILMNDGVMITAEIHTPLIMREIVRRHQELTTHK